MKVKKYRAATTKEAFAMARADLGEEAVLLHQRTLNGDARLGAVMVEITAAVDLEDQATSSKPDVRPFFPTDHASTRPTPTDAGRILAQPRPHQSSPGTPTPPAPRRNPAPKPNGPAASEYDALWREIRQIRALLQRQSGTAEALPEPLGIWRSVLRETLLPASIVDTLLLGLEDVLTPSALQRSDMVAATLAQRLAAAMPPVQGAIRPGQPGKPTVFVLVGPTGVGKTTTLAKLAARYSVQHRLPVALITADTFRIGAVGQLRTYSDLIRAPLEVAYTPQELAGHVARHQDKSMIFIDTPGRSPTDTDQLEVLRSFIEVLPNPHLQIAVAAGTLLADARRIVERFSVVPPSGMVLTKLDETTLFGPACALLAEAAIPLTYFTLGQRVPEDIDVASNEKLVDRLLHSARQQVDAEKNVMSISAAAMQTALDRLQPAGYVGAQA